MLGLLFTILFWACLLWALHALDQVRREQRALTVALATANAKLDALLGPGEHADGESVPPAT